MYRYLTLLMGAVLLLAFDFLRIYVQPASNPPAHPSGVFWAADFQSDYQDALKVWRLSDDDLYFLPADYAGAFIHFDRGFRRTTGQPPTWSSTIWLIGNSTVVNAEVPDDATIASRLQTLLPSVRVMNVGMAGAAIIHEYNRLRTLPVRPGDTVVFYDGLMEAELLANDALTYQEQQYSVCAQYRRWLQTLRDLCAFYDDRTPLYRDNAWLAPRLAPILARYRAVNAQARAWTIARGARFVHLLQPHLFTVPPTAYERWASDTLAPGAGIQWIYAVLWPRFAAIVDIDLSHVLDTARLRGAAGYVDGTHLDAEGNALIARAIYDYLVRVF